MAWADYNEDAENPDTPLKEMGGYFHKDVEIGDFDSAKRFYARVVKDYAEGALPRDRARTLGYLMAGYLSFFKLEYDREMLTRLEAVEKKLAEGPRR